ncbi:DUF3742 family protein [Pseudomonas caspiana]|nr:DUF3742 family protein [Pseudomonas caspiana]TPG90305.1 DUF3742 family protein [Pseudomonas caspiana]
MTNGDQPTRAMQFGRWVGRRWQSYLRYEEKTLSWLQRKGAPIKFSRFLGWLFKAVALITLLYVAFWITLILVAATIGAYAILNSDSSMYSEHTEWRDGLSGFGLYDQGGNRIDPHDPDEMP